jgi:hypothetical protein
VGAVDQACRNGTYPHPTDPRTDAASSLHFRRFVFKANSGWDTLGVRRWWIEQSQFQHALIVVSACLVVAGFALFLTPWWRVAALLAMATAAVELVWIISGEYRKRHMKLIEEGPRGAR